ncbi:MAG: hypothetical protein ACYC7D_13605 [Nitrososphaerales archaeon]
MKRALYFHNLRKPAISTVTRITIIAVILIAAIFSGFGILVQRFNTPITGQTASSTTQTSSSCSSILLTTTSSVSENRTYNFNHLPSNFLISDYSFQLKFQGFHAETIISRQGTTVTTHTYVYTGNYATFYVTRTLGKDLADCYESEGSTVFSWSPDSPMNSTLPEPSSVSLFGGNVTIGWSDNASAHLLLY